MGERAVLPRWPTPKYGLRLQEPCQHVADVVLTAEENGKNTDPLFRFVNFEPIDGPINRQVS